MGPIISALPPQIRELNLSHNYCEDIGIIQLEQRLKTNFSLTSLNLQENNITNIVTLVSSLTLSS